MKFQIDLFVVAAYVGLTWVYFTILHDPNLWVFAYIVIMTLCIDVQAHRAGMNRGADLMQSVMRQTLEEKGWDIVRKQP
jgi:hypothetical protein